MKNLFVSFLKEEEGSILEYLILIAIVAIIAAVMFPDLRRSVNTWFDDMIGNIGRGIGGGSNATNNSGSSTNNFNT